MPMLLAGGLRCQVDPERTQVFMWNGAGRIMGGRAVSHGPGDSGFNSTARFALSSASAFSSIVMPPKKRHSTTRADRGCSALNCPSASSNATSANGSLAVDFDLLRGEEVIAPSP